MDAYRIVLESQLGPREGTLRVGEEKAGVVSGSIVLLGVENAALGEWIKKNVLRLSHHLRTRVSDLECISVFEMEGGKVSGTLQSGRNTMLWHGEKMNDEEGGSEANAGK